MIEHFEVIATILILIIFALMLYKDKKMSELVSATEKKYYNLGYIDGVKRMEKEYKKHLKELSK